jgi:hypothetical protein
MMTWDMGRVGVVGESPLARICVCSLRRQSEGVRFAFFSHGTLSG